MTAKNESKKTKGTPQKTNKSMNALVFIETRGKTGMIGALDVMPKTSQVSLVNRVNIGSGLLTVVYEGEVAAAESAREASLKLVAGIGEVLADNVIPRPHPRIYSLVKSNAGRVEDAGLEGKTAVGMVETDGYASMIAAADSGIKSSDVGIPSWLMVGSGLTTVFFRGDVAAVHSAVESGASAAAAVGKVVAVHVIPRPHPGTEEVLPIGSAPKTAVLRDAGWDEAFGILETRGITGLVEGIDAGLKAASVTIQGWEKIGRGMTSTIFRGTVADVRSALDSAVSEASKVGKVESSYLIARPHSELDKGK